MRTVFTRLIVILLLMAGLGWISHELLVKPKPTSVVIAPPLATHSVYIWQRNWSSSISQAVTALNPQIAGWYLLAGQYDRNGWHLNDTPWQEFAHTQRPITAVFRLDGSNAEHWPQDIAQRVETVVAAMHSQGLHNVGVQIDFDCAAQYLPDYVVQLASLRSKLAPGLPLSVTALPAWLTHPASALLANSVDLVVWQLHNVDRPQYGLFDPQRALRWVHQINELNVAFAISLPTYSIQVRTDSQGAVTAAAGENALENKVGESIGSLQADPYQLQQFLQTLATQNFAHLQQLLWFRLPIAEDRNNWPLSVLQNLVSGQPIQSHVRWTLRPDPITHSYDLWLQVEGARPSKPLIAHIKGGRCDLGDGVRGAQFDQSLQQVRLAKVDWTSQEPQRVGWLRCSSQKELYLE